MDAHTRRLVWRRAAERCEYCRLPQRAVEATFHVEHVIARQHSGTDDTENLALACDRCNLYKGPNLSARDPETSDLVPLFNPRQQVWDEHFRFQGSEIVGQSPAGRATVQLLQMNANRRRKLRALLLTAGDLEV